MRRMGRFPAPRNVAAHEYAIQGNITLGRPAVRNYGHREIIRQDSLRETPHPPPCGPPSPQGRGTKHQINSLSAGRGGTARRWVRGLSEAGPPGILLPKLARIKATFTDREGFPPCSLKGNNFNSPSTDGLLTFLPFGEGWPLAIN